MSATDLVTPDPRRFSIRLPRPLWIGAATLVLTIIALVLRIGVPTYRQQVAIRAVEDAKGTVSTIPAGPPWLRRWVGEKWMRSLDSVTGVDLRFGAIPDSAFETISGLGHLRVLNLGDSQVTDAQLVYVAQFNNLETLDLRGTRIGDAGVANLVGLRKLWWLSLFGTQITDESIKTLAGLPNLKFVDVRATKIGDAGLPQFREFPRLTDLYLGSTRVTDAGMAELNGLQKLKLLDVGYTQVTDIGLSELQPPALHSLYLDGTQVTDAGLPHLKELRALRHVRFRQPSSNDIGADPDPNVWGIHIRKPLVTEAGLRMLKRELPHLEIDLPSWDIPR